MVITRYQMIGRSRTPEFAVPSLDLVVHTNPKNGGTSLLETLWFLKTGMKFPRQEFGKSGVYHKDAASILWGEQSGDAGRRMIVVRDPVDRAVSINCRGLRLGYFQGVSLETVLMNHEFWRRKSGDYGHHSKSQFHHAGRRTLDEFTHVIAFLRYPAVFDLLEEWSRIPLPRVHRQAAESQRPAVSPLARQLIRHIWREDYEHGFVNPESPHTS